MIRLLMIYEDQSMFMLPLIETVLELVFTQVHHDRASEITLRNMVSYTILFIYLGFYVSFNTVQVISQR